MLTCFFWPEFHLRKPEFTYSACGPFTKPREKIQKFKKTGDLKHIYKNKLHKAYFSYGPAYSDSKDVAKRTVSDKVLKGRA